MSFRLNYEVFIDAELQTFLEVVEKTKSFLFGKMSNVATNGAKKRVCDI